MPTVIITERDRKELLHMAEALLKARVGPHWRASPRSVREDHIFSVAHKWWTSLAEGKATLEELRDEWKQALERIYNPYGVVDSGESSSPESGIIV